MRFAGPSVDKHSPVTGTRPHSFASPARTQARHEHETKPKLISRLGDSCVDQFPSISDTDKTRTCVIRSLSGRGLLLARTVVRPRWEKCMYFQSTTHVLRSIRCPDNLAVLLSWVALISRRVTRLTTGPVLTSCRNESDALRSIGI